MILQFFGTGVHGGAVIALQGPYPELQSPDPRQLQSLGLDHAITDRRGIFMPDPFEVPGIRITVGRILGIDPVHVLDQLASLGPQMSGEVDRGQIGTATTEQNQSIVRIQGHEAWHHDHRVVVQQGVDGGLVQSDGRGIEGITLGSKSDGGEIRDGGRDPVVLQGPPEIVGGLELTGGERRGLDRTGGGIGESPLRGEPIGESLIGGDHRDHAASGLEDAMTFIDHRGEA